MFRDSRGVVHTVSAADPLVDLPPEAAAALQRALLQPVEGDIGNALERCDALRELVERWQDAFFAALPDEVDLDEERHWATLAGMSLDDIEAEWADEDPEPEYDEDDVPDEDDDDLLGEAHLLEDALLDNALLDDALLDNPLLDDDEDPRAVLPDELVSVLERELLLLPVRTRLEALVAAADLVTGWSDLLADEEKLLGHLVLGHGQETYPRDHEGLADRHAALHAEAGPGHGVATA